MSLPKDMTKSINRNRKRRRNRGTGNKEVQTASNVGGSASRHEFLPAKKSSIPLPEQVFDSRLGIVTWGKDNVYPYYLNWLFRNNPMHAGIVRAKRYFTTAGGLVYDGADVDVWETFFKNNKRSSSDKDMGETIDDGSLNNEKSNLICMEIRLTATVKNGGRSFRRMLAIPFEKIRYDAKEENSRVVLTGKIKVSDDWTNDNIKPRVLEPYNPADPNQTVFFIIHQEESGQSLNTPKDKKINPGIYPDPPYGGAIVSIDTGIAIAKHGNAEIHNGFSLGTAISMRNGPPKLEEDKQRIEKGIKNAATGEDQTGGIWIEYVNGADRSMEIKALNGNNLPDRYQNAKKGGEDSIIHGHSIVTPSLFGVATPGELGNTQQIQSGYAIMQANLFDDRRAPLLTILNWVGKTFAGLQGEIKFGEAVLSLETKISTDEGSKVVDALNSMSPLVATKVLESMTMNERRRLGSLPPMPGGDDLPIPTASLGTPAALSKKDKDKIMERLRSCGRPRDNFMELYSSSASTLSEAQENELLNEFLKSCFNDLPDNMLQTLNLIQQGQDFNSIRQALDISGPELAGIYKKLQSLKMISTEGKLLKAGASELVSSEIAAMEILYEYALRDGFKEDIIPGTRDFCRELVGLNRLYTREEIGMISGAEGYDVFAYRGGWYHNPDTDVNEPGCRHEWKQVITFGKK